MPFAIHGGVSSLTFKAQSHTEKFGMSKKIISQAHSPFNHVLMLCRDKKIKKKAPNLNLTFVRLTVAHAAYIHHASFLLLYSKQK